MEKLMKILFATALVYFIFLLLSHGNALVTNTTIVVLKDGKGDFKFVSDAIASIPNRSEDQYIVYIKKDVNSHVLFIARKISIVNSAGETAGQAVALRSNGESDAYHLCSIEEFQGTLLINGGKKFFYNCSIYGTVDFIFGDAKVIF